MLDPTVILSQLLDGQSLSIEDAKELMESWIEQRIPDVLSSAILIALQAKGVSSVELAGMAQTLKTYLDVPKNFPDNLIDTCGTGGDGAATFNISTAVAFVASSAGIYVAKHGNRSASSRVGSADVLEALGLNLNAPPHLLEAALSEVGITFLFAPNWHPALKSVAQLRKTLKIRTVFNLLGPLVNPFCPTSQVLGVYGSHLIEVVAQSLKLLGLKRAIVLHGREKLDEAGLGDITDLAILNEGTVSRGILEPRELGLNPFGISALVGGDLNENALILKNVLQGKGTIAQQEVVILNSALALEVGQIVPLGEHDRAIDLARDIISSGAAFFKLEALIKFLNS